MFSLASLLCWLLNRPNHNKPQQTTTNHNKKQQKTTNNKQQTTNNKQKTNIIYLLQKWQFLGLFCDLTARKLEFSCSLHLGALFCGIWTVNAVRSRSAFMHAV